MFKPGQPWRDLIVPSSKERRDAMSKPLSATVLFPHISCRGVPCSQNSPFVIEILLLRIRHFKTKSITARSDQFRAQKYSCNRNIASRNSACLNQVNHGAIWRIPSSKVRREAMSKPLSATVSFVHVLRRGVPCSLNRLFVIEILRVKIKHV